MNFQVWQPILFYVGLIGLTFYFLLYRPSKKQKDKIANMQNSIKMGDTVITIGGIIGTVSKIESNVISLSVLDEEGNIKVVRSAIQKNMADDSL